MERSSCENAADSYELSEAMATLAAKHEELRLLVRTLEASAPSPLLTILALEVSVAALLGAVTLVIAPFFRPGFPGVVSQLGAFATVPLAFISYLSYRRYVVERERHRLHRRVLQQALALEEATTDVLGEINHSEAFGVGT